MFSFLKRKAKAAVYIPEPMHFMGKCPVDPEYIRFGGNENFIIFIDGYLKELHKQLIQSRTDSISTVPDCNFLVVDNEKFDTLVGLVGPSLDKSERENLFLLSRHIMNGFIKTYPLFIPLLYDEFFLESRWLLKNLCAVQSLQVFQQSVSQLNLMSVYSDKQKILNASVDKLLTVSIDNYQSSLRLANKYLTKAQLMNTWRGWRELVCRCKQDKSLLPLKIELPSDDNLNYYVAFACQIIEPLFENLPYYRIIWWQDKQRKTAWCFITEQRIDSKIDLVFLNTTSTPSIFCLTHDEQAKETEYEAIDSLLDVLQVLPK